MSLEFGELQKNNSIIHLHVLNTSGISDALILAEKAGFKYEFWDSNEIKECKLVTLYATETDTRVILLKFSGCLNPSLTLMPTWH